MGENIIVDKSFRFAVRIISIYKFLIREEKEFVLGRQLLRSGISIGANIREGINGVSKADFKNKLGIALKEAKETEYWLELLIATDILNGNCEEVSKAVGECNELCRILSSIIKTCNNQISKA